MAGKKFNYDYCVLPGVQNNLKKAITREKQIMENLEHENIVSLIRSDFIEKTDQKVLAFEYFKIGSLKKIIDEHSNGFPSEHFFQIAQIPNCLPAAVIY